MTKLAEHSYQRQFCKNKFARFDLAKKHFIDSCRACRRYLDEETDTDDSDVMDLSRRVNEVDDSGRRRSRRNSGASRRNSVPGEELSRRRTSRRNSTPGEKCRDSTMRKMEGLTRRNSWASTSEMTRRKSEPDEVTMRNSVLGAGRSDASAATTRQCD